MAATYTVPALNGASIQATINSAFAGGSSNTVFLPAGIYNISSPITVPCTNGLTITGPVATPATAILNATYVNNSIFLSGPGCTSVTAEYLQFANTGPWYFAAGNNSGVTFVHNQVTKQPSKQSNAASESLYFGGGSTAYTQSNITIKYNTFGDSSSCTAVFADTGVDDGGSCAAVLFQSNLVNIDFEYNLVVHMEEGIHETQLNYSSGHPAYYANNFVVRHNYFLNFHRIAVEIQMGVIGNPVYVSDNVLQDPGNTYFGTLSISTPCCQFTNVFGTATTVSPALYDNDNVLAYSVGPNYAPYGFEFWGVGTQGDNDVVQGFICNGFTWGFGTAPWQIENSVIQGSKMAPGGCGGYITNQQGQSNPPTQSGNITGPTPTAQVSVAPTISPAAGSYTSPPMVTLSDSGLNTSIYYTTDGSTPVPGSGTTRLYTAPFLITLPTTIKSVGMWGVPPQPLAYVAGYGYVPSAVQSTSYIPTGGVTLASVALNNVGAIHSLIAGAAIQMSATCTYSDGSSSDCTNADSHGNGVSSWASSNPAVVSISGSGLASGVAAGTATVTAVVAGMTTPAWAMAVTPPAVSLSSVGLSTTGGASTLAVSGVNQLLATCTYSDSSRTNCATTDANGNVVSPWTSSAPTVATVSSSGVVTGQAAGSTNLTATVAPSMTTTQWGQTAYNTAGHTSAGYINSTYFVLGTQAGGYSGRTCSFYLPSGTLTVGSLFDCGLISAPTPTTQGTAWQCYWTYTVTSSTAPGAFVSGNLSSCGNLAAGSAWWVGVATNAPGTPTVGFSNCGGACSGSAPTLGNGTYPYRTIAVPYGTRSGMPTAMAATGSTLQAAQFVTLGQPNVTSNAVPLTVTASTPTLMSAYLSTPGSTTTMTVGGTLQFAARCVYSDSSTTDCSVADIHGNAVTSWTTSNAGEVTIGAVSSTNPGLATAIAPGTPSVQAYVGSLASSAFALTISAPAVTLTGISLATTGGVTGLFVGSTNALIATCIYSDGSTTNCTAVDSHGNQAGGYSSSTPAHATVNAASGLVSGVAAGTTTLTGTAGSFTSIGIPLTVLAIPSGTYYITITGPVSFAGKVQF